MNITERLDVIRAHNHHQYYDSCGHCGEIDEHLDAIQAEVEQILARLPAEPDTTPAHITLTAS